MVSDAHAYQTRVRYAEIDRMGVAYHSRYIEWFEAARTELLRESAVTYDQMEESGISLPVIEVRAHYFKPVFYDELVTIFTRVSHVDRLKLHLSYQLYGERNEALRAEGYTIHCFVNAKGSPIRVNREWVAFFENAPGDLSTGVKDAE